jgi:NADPH:quinone reductase
MKALQLTAYGGTDGLKLAELPRPEPRRQRVVVRVEAAGLNYSDLMIMQNTYLETMPLPYVLGREFVGEVVATGPGVGEELIGARVVGSSRGGAFAEYVEAAVNAVRPVPDFLSAGAALALQVQGMTALHCLQDVGGLSRGEIVLIHAAAGGVGTLAVQLAQLLGAGQVFGTASSAEKCALVEELGATAINYTEGDWVASLQSHTGNSGANLILESVGGDVFLRSFREALASFGRLVVFGASSQKVSKLSNVEILGSGKSVHGYFLPQFYHPTRRHRIAEAWHQLLLFAEQEQLRVIVGDRFGLDDAAAAIEQMQQRGSIGKVLITP